MKPILYRAEETAFTTNGVGILSDVIDCSVIQTLNGQYELEMKYPVKGIHFLEIQQRTIITAKPDPVTDSQPFRVYRITKPLNGVVTIYARHVAYDLMGVTVSPFSASSVAATLQEIKNHAVGECSFSFWTDKDAAATMTVKVPTSAWSLLGGTKGSVLDCFGGEYEFDRWMVRLHNHRGTDRGVSIRYGKNLTSLEQDENCANCYTGVYPYWANAKGDYVELPEKTVSAKGDFGYSRILPLDLSSEWKEAPTNDQLRNRAEKYVSDNAIGEPVVSWKVGFVALEQTEEYKGIALLERIMLGDTVSVELAQMGISVSARAVEQCYKPVLERYESVTLGSVKTSLADTIASQQREIHSKPDQTQMQMAIATLTAAILGASGGAVRLLDGNGDGMPDTLYIADNPDPAKAVKVWRFNYEGWGASKTGYNGPFIMGATLEGGFLADFITAGTLNASLIKTGTIKSSDGSLEFDLINNRFTFYAQKYDNKIGFEFDPMYGFVGFGYDVATGGLSKFLRVFPGSRAQTGSYVTPLITTFDGLMLSIYGNGGTNVGNYFSDTKIEGKSVLVNGKVVSWKANGDGTFTLIGS